MRIIERITVPTGDILVVQGFKGPLEMLSLGDYGKDVNVKADFLGHTIPPKPVRHTALLPLEKKWVLTVSTQYGCSMGCDFCDVPRVGPGKNATFRDLAGQLLTGLQLHPEVAHSERLNVHFARMGEPTWNPHVLDAAKWLHDHVDPEYHVHPVVSTMMPRKNEWLKTFIHTWMRIKNRVYRGNAGLQLSINSTDDAERARCFNGNALSLPEIAGAMDGIIPVGRKIALNFAVANYTVDAEELAKWLSPDLYMVKLTPMHKTRVCVEQGIETDGDYTSHEPYADLEERLKAVGYDVLVFMASVEEDLGRITCGNAILSGTRLETPSE
jgi:23S rRNA (adenine2503-C2)-methyltransferase